VEKTTVIKMLTGLLRSAAAGLFYVEGLDVRTDSEAVREAHRHMSQKLQPLLRSTVTENLQFYGRNLQPRTAGV